MSGGKFLRLGTLTETRFHHQESAAGRSSVESSMPHSAADSVEGSFPVANLEIGKRRDAGRAALCPSATPAARVHAGQRTLLSPRSSRTGGDPISQAILLVGPARQPEREIIHKSFTWLMLCLDPFHPKGSAHGFHPRA